MDAIGEARIAANEAAKRVHELADGLDQAADDADLDALDAEFTEATAEAERTSANLKTLESRKAARDSYPVIVSDTASNTGAGQNERITFGSEERTYSKTRKEFDSRTMDGKRESYFTDLYEAQVMRRQDAQERIDRHQAESRALNETAGTGGEFVPPLWMQDEWVKLARASRPTADACNDMPLPDGTNSINLPTVSTGTATAAQADGGTVQSTDMASSSVTATVKTIAGQQDVARQLLDRSVPGIDQVIFDDLSRDYATKLDVQVLNGSGAGANATGILNVASINTSTYTDATPTVGELYSKMADIVQKIHANRFLPPEAFVMHPVRWGWILAALDTTNRPLVTPYAPFNATGILERVASENVVGNLLGLPVIVDASIPTTLGAGTEDAIICARFSDLYLFEQPSPGVNVRTFEEVLSGNLQIRFQVWGYFAFLGNRYAKAIGKITGTGLIAPTF